MCKEKRVNTDDKREEGKVESWSNKDLVVRLQESLGSSYECLLSLGGGILIRLKGQDYPYIDFDNVQSMVHYVESDCQMGGSWYVNQDLPIDTVIRLICGIVYMKGMYLLSRDRIARRELLVCQLTCKLPNALEPVIQVNKDDWELFINGNARGGILVLFNAPISCLGILTR